MKRHISRPEHRLVVAADFEPSPPNGRQYVRDMVLRLADKLKGTGVFLKVNSALRSSGYNLIGEIQHRDLHVFADLKLIDIPETLKTEGLLLREGSPEILTVMCTAGVSSIRTLKEELPHTEILGVSVLTSHDEGDTQDMFACKIKEATLRLAYIAVHGEADGLTSSPMEVETIRQRFNLRMTINTPGIRTNWATVEGDDQDPKRTMSPADAINAGADRIIIGRPILRSKNPYDAVMRTLEEIANATN